MKNVLLYVNLLFFFFFFQAEDGIRDGHVTGVQTCALRSSHARPGTGFLIGFAPETRPIPLDQGQIAIKISGEDDKPIFVQAGSIAGKHELAAATDALFKSAQPWSVENFGKRGTSFFAIANGASHLRLSGFH